MYLVICNHIKNPQTGPRNQNQTYFFKYHWPYTTHCMVSRLCTETTVKDVRVHLENSLYLILFLYKGDSKYRNKLIGFCHCVFTFKGQYHNESKYLPFLQQINGTAIRITALRITPTARKPKDKYPSLLCLPQLLVLLVLAL